VSPLLCEYCDLQGRKACKQLIGLISLTPPPAYAVAGLQMLRSSLDSHEDKALQGEQVPWEKRHHTHTLAALLQLLQQQGLPEQCTPAAAQACLENFKDLMGELQVLGGQELYMQLEGLLQQVCACAHLQQHV